MEMLKGKWKYISFSMVNSIISVLLSVLPYFAVSTIMTLIFEKTYSFDLFVKPISIIFLGLIGSVVFHKISTLSSHKLAFRIIGDARISIVQKLEKLSMGEIEKKSSGQWTQFIDATLDKMELPIAHVIPEVIGNLIAPILITIIIFFLRWEIGIAHLISLPLTYIFMKLGTKNYADNWKKKQEDEKIMNTTLVEYIKGIKVIKVFNKSASSYSKYQEVVDNYRTSLLSWYTGSCFSVSAMIEILPSSLLFVLPVSMFIFINGKIDISNMILCVLLSYACYTPLLKVMSHFESVATLKVLTSEINSVMHMQEIERGKVKQNISDYSVEFENVSFSYNDETEVFNNLSFKAESNKLTAIVGYSGSGKSTIAKLIAGFWNVDYGKIKIGKIDLRNIPLEQNMDIVTYVSQENYLFKKSIIENIRMAKKDANKEEIIEVCKKASCHEFIESLSNGYETIVGDAGASLSGGERQRITIARALLKNSPIVLFDEATAYSDPDNEAIIQKSINKLIKNKTVIMVAHRLSTIMNADKIIVLNAGKIDSVGTHKELLEKSIVYQKMWKSHINVSENQGGYNA